MKKSRLEKALVMVLLVWSVLRTFLILCAYLEGNLSPLFSCSLRRSPKKEFGITLQHVSDTFSSHFYVIVIKMQKLPESQDCEN